MYANGYTSILIKHQRFHPCRQDLKVYDKYKPMSGIV